LEIGTFLPRKGEADMKVLLPTEGSDLSMAAIKRFCRMFDESDNTEVEIFSAAEPVYTPTEPFGVSGDYIRDLDKAAMERANDAVARAEADVREDFPDLTAGLTTKVVHGSPAQAIVEEAEKWGADLIIMGSHGYGFWKRALLGSVSNAVVHHAPCSVLVIRSPEKLNGNH
jgi:nucleotide-binding universal stress UspA family protein